MSRSLLRVALVGCGIISENHIHAYSRHADRAKIVVCCDIDEAKAKQRAEEIGDCRVTTSYEEVLADPEVDSIELLTPHHLHPDGVIAAAKAGKHILCQKPLAKTLADCDSMIAAAEAAGVTLFYGETNRTLPAAILARKTVEEGRIGTLVGIQATCAHWQGGRYLSTAWRYNPAITGGGQLLDGGIHCIDLMLQIGGTVESVSCATHRFRPELGGEDTAAVLLRYAEGHLGTLFSSQASGMWSPAPGLTVFGTEGLLTLGGPYGALALHREDLPEHRETLLERNGDSFTVMIGRYLETVLDGASNPSPAAIGRQNLKVVLAAYQAAEQGGEVSLSEQSQPERK